ncbi:hypothetical protein [Streptomyces sp. AC550_RSS872]|uniref:hypothetical protein n=1 Tax=Streptomyces sp. AC550_RSS872 TaxID=2823689 RepID=UPI001C25DD92|nr:hypothetical protein [Streptomyces sp. AC550_RSS872]
MEGLGEGLAIFFSTSPREGLGGGVGGGFVTAGRPTWPSGDCRGGAVAPPGGPFGTLRRPAEGPAVTTVSPPPLPSAVRPPSLVKAAAATATAPTTSSPEIRIPRETAITPPEVLAPDD